jgi:hypothetical protein
MSFDLPLEFGRWQALDEGSDWSAFCLLSRFHLEHLMMDTLLDLHGESSKEFVTMKGHKSGVVA